MPKKAKPSVSEDFEKEEDQQEETFDDIEAQFPKDEDSEYEEDVESTGEADDSEGVQAWDDES
ncbi:hypothetical protein J4219_06005 [Candidatus Woesearchaeota archaeon]|nr:hypothetical protein [Candidatus Woesearchaeota archaeon]